MIKKIIINSIILSFIFVGILVFLLTSLRNNDINEQNLLGLTILEETEENIRLEQTPTTLENEESNMDVFLKEEKILNVLENKQTINETTIRKDGYYEKPFAEGNYSYEERTPDFRLVCIDPCPVNEQILKQEFAAIDRAVATLRGLTKSDLHSDLLPFEVHASEDSICHMIPKFAAYMKGRFVDANDYQRGLLCFFYDKIYYDRSKFPYSASIHEVTHLFEYKKVPYHPVLWEGLSEMMDSFFLKGNEKNSFCWEGNDWYGTIVNNPHDPHGTGRQLFFTLCKKYGFDYEDLPELFKELDSRNVDIKEFVNVINNLVGKDTSHLFKEAGVIS